MIHQVVFHIFWQPRFPKSSNAGSTSGTTPPASGWQEQVPTVPGGQFLWTRTVWTYTDNTSETGYSSAKMGQDGAKGDDGIAGKDGVGIADTLIEYAVNTSGTVKPTSGWSTTIPTTPQGQYLWTKTTWTYTDDTSEVGYTVARQGNNGTNGNDGIGIKTSVVDYQSSSSGTSVPAGPWMSAPPPVEANQYLWTRTRLTMTDDSETTSYSVGKMGADGQDGQDGKTTYFHRAWSNSSDGSIEFSTTDSLNKGYLGTYTDFEEEPSLDPAKYTWTELVSAFPRLYVQEEEPTDMKEGDQWWKKVDGVVTEYSIYMSGRWESQKIDQAILNIVTLNAVNINGSIIAGSEFINSWDFDDSTETHSKGEMIIKDGSFKQDSVYTATGNPNIPTGTKLGESHLELNYGQIKLGYSSYNTITGLPSVSTSANLIGGTLNLTLVDETGSYNGALTAKALTNTGWKDLRLGTNFEIKENNKPQYKVIWQLDGSRLIKFRGQFGYKSGNMRKGNSIYPFQAGDGGSASGESYFPAEIIPDITAFGYGATSTGVGGRLAVTRTPRFIFIPGEDCTYCSLESLQYIIE